MCGIVGYAGGHQASSILVEGLKRLEYRGYDSAGVALHEGDSVSMLKKVGRVNNVAALVRENGSTACTGISHTRWATHGGVTDANAHPHPSSDGRIVLVHNGVIENHQAIRRFLAGEGFTFQSETDSEVLANLVAFHYRKLAEDNGINGNNPFARAVRHALRQVEGTYGLAILCADRPGQMIGARKGSPLILGVGHGENMIGSDVAAFGGRTQNVVYLDDGQVVEVSASDFNITTMAEDVVEPVIDRIAWKIEEAELGDYSHYMEKEIFEQPKALENAMRGRFSDDESSARFGGLNMDARELRQVDRILFCACGTAWHACLVAEYLIEKFARIPVEVEYASEFRYRNSPLDKNTLVIAVSQSGETLDTLEALREARRKGFRTLAINNCVGSSIARECDGGIYQYAGPEIGVASTKAFTSQVQIASMLALYLGRLRDLSFSDGIDYVRALRSVPALVTEILDREAPRIKAIARKYAHYNDFLFLGRQIMFPIALEGALKLKEISYIHAEGYPAAEMKHGPIALVSPECPSVVLANNNEVYSKVLANIQEIRARSGPVIAITTEDGDFPEEMADERIMIPACHEGIAAVLSAIPVQLLSYYIACERGCDVDKPRNLAKSVTVE